MLGRSFPSEAGVDQWVGWGRVEQDRTRAGQDVPGRARTGPGQDQDRTRIGQDPCGQGEGQLRAKDYYSRT